MAKKQLTEEEIAKKEIKRNRILGWTLGLGGGASLAALAFSIVFKSIGGTIAVDNSFLGVLLDNYVWALCGLVLGSLAGFLRGSTLAKNDKYIQSQLEGKTGKLNKNKEAVIVEEVEEQNLPKAKKLQSQVIHTEEQNVVIVRNLANVVVGTFRPVQVCGLAELKNGFFSSEDQLRNLVVKLGVDFPADGFMARYNGKEVATYEPKSSSSQTGDHNNANEFAKFVDGICNAVYPEKTKTTGDAPVKVDEVLF